MLNIQAENPEASTKQKYLSTNNRALPTLINKEQLNTLITDKNGKPDYLAINIYFDTLRSWYNPKIGYKKDGNLYHINKLKTPGIFLNIPDLPRYKDAARKLLEKK